MTRSATATLVAVSAALALPHASRAFCGGNPNTFVYCLTNDNVGSDQECATQSTELAIPPPPPPANPYMFSGSSDSVIFKQPAGAEPAQVTVDCAKVSWDGVAGVQFSTTDNAKVFFKLYFNGTVLPENNTEQHAIPCVDNVGNDCDMAFSRINAEMTLTPDSQTISGSEFFFGSDGSAIDVEWNLDTSALMGGDPHVVGPYHRQFDYLGQTGSAYALVSTADVQVNGEMTAFDETTSRWRGQTFITRIGVVLSNGAVVVVLPGAEFDDVVDSYLSVEHGSLVQVSPTKFRVVGDSSSNDAELLVRFGGKTIEVRHCGERYFVKRRVEFPAHLDIAADVAHSKWPSMAGVLGQLFYSAGETREIDAIEGHFLLDSLASTAFSVGSTFRGVSDDCHADAAPHASADHANVDVAVDGLDETDRDLVYNVLNDLDVPQDNPGRQLFND